MSITYHFDLYPRLDPVSGALVRRLVNLQQAEYRGEANGTGSGKIILRGNSEDAAFLDPQGMQYVRVVRDDGATEVVVGGFFLENGDYEALTERSTKKLTFGGAGTLSYLNRAIAAEQTYIAGSEGPFDDTWHWYYSPAGGILHRMVQEATDPDRPQSPISGVTMTFAEDLDSDGNPWPGYGTSWLFTAQVREGLVPIMLRLMQAGVYVWMDPDTFALSAWMANAHGRDRTGGAWGTNVVRFQSPTDATIATANIKSDTHRGIAALVKRSDLLVGGANGNEWVNDPGADLVWEGGYGVDDPTGTSLSQIGAAQLAARSDAGDTVRLRMMIDNAPLSGKYLPFEHVQLDDRVTLHTGTGQWDWNETEQKVAAITLQLRSGGDWDAWVDLGSKYSSIEERAFQVAPVGAHTHEDRFFVDAGSSGFNERMRMRDYGGGSSALYYNLIGAARGSATQDAYIALDNFLDDFQIDLHAFDFDTVGEAHIGLSGTSGDIVMGVSRMWSAYTSGLDDASKHYFLGGWGIVFPIIDTDPAGSASEIGQVYYNSVSNTLRWYDGSVWADVDAGHTHVYSETPSGTINGSNAAFTLAATPASGTLRLYKNGLRQKVGSGNDYTLSTNTITYEAGNVPQTGESHLADYE